MKYCLLFLNGVFLLAQMLMLEMLYYRLRDVLQETRTPTGAHLPVSD
ncbi:hypothetical protein [Georgfuchsia toluolica]|nr:hypothetical protein [Georgfuchsia toluolica]